MSPEEAKRAVHDRANVRLRFADGSERATGRVVSYSLVPCVTIELEDGTQVSWRHDMADVVPEQRTAVEA